MRLLYVVGKKYNPLVGGPTKKQVLQVKRGETVAIWKGARTQSVWEYTIGCAATKIQTARVAVFFIVFLFVL